MVVTTRRAALIQIAEGALLTGFSARSFSCSWLGFGGGEEPSSSERDAMANVAAAFMERFDVPGLSVAIARKGKLVYQQPFGVASRLTGENLSSSHLFRIASVTKPFTSVAIFMLIEQGKIRRDDPVFGKGGVLGNRYGTPPYKKYVEDITIDQLLTHTCGGWDNGRDDPMFANLSLDHAQLISETLDKRPLDNIPGTHFSYSNFGYCVLGRVIEAITQQSYRDYVQRAILGPCGITEMRISGNTLDQRAANEVTYYGQSGEDPYGMNVERMDSHGGWLANPADLVRFATHVDGFTTTQNILKPETIRIMTTPSDLNANYARGWSVNSMGNWWHTGSLPGTTTIMVRTSSGFCWAALTNTRRQPTEVIGLALDNLVWDMARKVRSWAL